jgi:hypothetical protein
MATFERSASIIYAFRMTIAPFRKFISKRIKRNNMIPLEPARFSGFSFGNVAVIVNHISSLSVLRTTIKGCLVATVNFLYQDSLSLAKGLHRPVAFPIGINRSCHETDQRQ